MLKSENLGGEGIMRKYVNEKSLLENKGILPLLKEGNDFYIHGISGISLNW